MLKGEIEILKAVALNKCTFKQITNSQVARNSPYIISTINALVQHGYLTKSETQDYQLTAKGARALFQFLPANTTTSKTALYRLLHKHLARAKGAVKMIETLGTEYTKMVEELENQK